MCVRSARDFCSDDLSLFCAKKQISTTGLLKVPGIQIAAHDARRGMYFEIEQFASNFVRDHVLQNL